jgi:NADH:ubiquinone oxidoreductase subunit D
MRLKGVGVLTKEDAVDYSALGPTARASGYDVDIRRDEPYAAYDKVKWNVITQKEGDVFAKAVVRILELIESIKIVNQCLDYLPNGPIDAGVKQVSPGDGIVYSHGEMRRHQPSGEAQSARADLYEFSDVQEDHRRPNNSGRDDNISGYRPLLLLYREISGNK